MSGISIPHDRTTKQQVMGYCLNPDCKPNPHTNDYFSFAVDHDRFACPRCGANKPPFVGVQVLTHWLVQDNKGPIEGEGGLRWKIACDQDRAYLATFSNLEAATKAFEVANCPGCKNRNTGE
jgi:hypothetical protein